MVAEAAADAAKIFLEILISYVHRKMTREIPELLRLCENVLAGAPFPKDLNGLKEVSFDNSIRLIPPMATLVVLLTWAYALIHGPSRTAESVSEPINSVSEPKKSVSEPKAHVSRLGEYGSEPKNPKDLEYSFWTARYLFLRGMGLIYLVAFFTSCMQSRSLFGSIGLTPSINSHTPRPIPAFWALEWIGIPRGDLALEIVSWFGLILSGIQFFGIINWGGLLVLLWGLYLSLGPNRIWLGMANPRSRFFSNIPGSISAYT
ncbi:hypothetical protein AAMO2058_000082100 [Amorphochlora amoebiformis]